VFNEKHLRRLLREYIAHYNAERTHYNLSKDSPFSRSIQTDVSPQSYVQLLA
jgi:hypothetical protein